MRERDALCTSATMSVQCFSFQDIAFNVALAPCFSSLLSLSIFAGIRSRAFAGESPGRMYICTLGRVVVIKPGLGMELLSMFEVEPKGGTL